MTAADAGAILSFPIGYRGFTLNEHRTSGGAITAANVENTVMVEKFDFSPLEFRDQRDGLHLLMGGDLGMVSDQFRYVSIAGIIKGSSAALLEDRVAKFLSAFHPVNCFAASPTTRGVHDLDFYCPTATRRRCASCSRAVRPGCRPCSSGAARATRCSLRRN
jgi:hypothetical protein